MHDDRRLYPRITTDLGARVRLGQDTLPVQMVNLSLGGFLIEGGGRLATLASSPATGTIEFSVSFELEEQELTSECRVVYKRRLSADKAALGLKIIGMNDAARAAIEAYVHKNLNY